VAALGEILRRFRFHGVPGAPSSVAVPADRPAELERELAPVFAALDDAEAAARAILDRALREADRRRAEATDAAMRAVAEANASAAAARSESATATLEVAETTRTRLLEAARAEAERIADQSAERAPALVEKVVAHVLAFGTSESGGSR
jgi:vacuolar-type H+-ATPase subunit H